MEAEHLKVAGRKNVDLLTLTDVATDFQMTEIQADNINPVIGDEIILGFRVGSLGFLVTDGIYYEVVERSQVNPLPNVEPWFSGLLNIRGNIVPVIDLRILLDETAADNKKRYLFAIDQGEKTMVLWIDSLPEMQRVIAQPLEQLPVLTPLMQRHVSGGYWVKDKIWLNIRFDDLFKTLGSQGRQNAAGKITQ